LSCKYSMAFDGVITGWCNALIYPTSCLVKDKQIIEAVEFYNLD